MIHFLVWMRLCAVLRHRVVHATLEGGDPKSWPAHEALITRVYGF